MTKHESTILLEEGVLSVAAAAEFLSVSTKTIYRLMDTGELPYAQIRGRRRIPRRALIEMTAKSMIRAVG
jgi:excisionase family DNA binding protein